MQKQNQILKCSNPRGETKPAATATIRRSASSLPHGPAKPKKRQKAPNPTEGGSRPSSC